ncbi:MULTISPECIES: hypothetical protein [Streptomyces]|nr:hypothetical protein [Streptomyces sp. NEAU-HV9]
MRRVVFGLPVTTLLLIGISAAPARAEPPAGRGLFFVVCVHLSCG